MASTVYFSSARTTFGNNMHDKLIKLFRAAGVADNISPKDLVAVKLHWGERGNLAYLPPPLVATLLREVEAAGGCPFVTDANTLYNGSRRNAYDNLMTAYGNGFSPAVIGAPVIVADGLFGDDFAVVPISGGKHFESCKIASVVHRANSLISIAHFKGHEGTGFGGTLKNIGMGCAAPSGKQNQHSDVKPKVTLKKCTGCRSCAKKCPVDAISFNDDKKAQIDREKCIGCADCTIACRFDAIAVNWKSDLKIMQEKMAEYALAVIQQKLGKCAFFNVIINVTPDCDCCNFSDVPIVPDLGIVVSKDPVAADQAAVDLVNKAPGIPSSKLGDKAGAADKFRAIAAVDWRHQLDHAEKIGLGSREYKLVAVE
jgi:uncharacterized protein